MDTLSFTPRIASHMHIRIIDPDLSTCEALSVVFRLEGFQTSFSIDFDRALFSKTPINVIVLNLDLPGGSGIALLQKAKAELGGVPVFMLANSTDVDAAVLAMKFGAEDVLTKPIDIEHLVGLVRTSLRRDVHLGASRDGERHVEVRGFSRLTDREREVLQLIVNGSSNKEAGRQLKISPRTVEVHRARVMRKLDARNAADLIRIVMTR